MIPHVCSWRIGFILDNGLRRLVHDPYAILKDHVGPGQTAVDIGCGPGFFTLPLVRQVGQTGTVIAVDLQPRMLETVRRKADRAGINNQLRLHACRPDRLGIDTRADFVLAFYMVHEVPDRGSFFRETHQMLKPGGRLLVVEPRFHVTAKTFQRICASAEEAGLDPAGQVDVALSRGRLFARPSGRPLPETA